ncbi:MAG: hypothetical protein PVJ33_16410 [Lysobacterales bacterium]|jgi:hypothetical protein
MGVEQFLSGKLRRFSVVDIGFVKAVYFLFGLLVYSVYPPLTAPDWWFWLLLGIISGFPLVIHFFSFAGSWLAKGRAYLESNSPALQVLLFLTQLFVAFTVAALLPALAGGAWWIYLGLIVLLAIKPMTRTVFW